MKETEEKASLQQCIEMAEVLAWAQKLGEYRIGLVIHQKRDDKLFLSIGYAMQLLTNIAENTNPTNFDSELVHSFFITLSQQVFHEYKRQLMVLNDQIQQQEILKDFQPLQEVKKDVEHEILMVSLPDQKEKDTMPRFITPEKARHAFEELFDLAKKVFSYINGVSMFSKNDALQQGLKEVNSYTTDSYEKSTSGSEITVQNRERHIQRVIDQYNLLSPQIQLYTNNSEEMPLPVINELHYCLHFCILLLSMYKRNDNHIPSSLTTISATSFDWDDSVDIILSSLIQAYHDLVDCVLLEIQNSLNFIPSMSKSTDKRLLKILKKRENVFYENRDQVSSIYNDWVIATELLAASRSNPSIRRKVYKEYFFESREGGSSFFQTLLERRNELHNLIVGPSPS